MDAQYIPTVAAPLTDFDGVLWIGDVHASSTRPGRRTDDYSAACLDKLRQAAVIANERNLFPVCLGDLFHRARDNNLVFLSQLMDVLRLFRVPMRVLAGSHDRTENLFTEKDVGHLLAKLGLVVLIEHPGKFQTLQIGAERVNLYATPAGCRIPDSVPAEAGSTNIMVTHHDLDFRGMYPGAHELAEIRNCCMLVNGHMHTPTPMVIKGQTVCHNPGSIMRVSVDLKNHQPVVSAWTPAHGSSLEAINLVVAAHVFDLVGTEVFAADPKELKASLPKGLRLSSFAAKLHDAESLGADKTDDGAVLLEEFQSYFTIYEKPDNLKRYLTGMLDELINERLEAVAK